jgi:hypothetical protein
MDADPLAAFVASLSPADRHRLIVLLSAELDEQSTCEAVRKPRPLPRDCSRRSIGSGTSHLEVIRAAVAALGDAASMESTWAANAGSLLAASLLSLPARNSYDRPVSRSAACRPVSASHQTLANGRPSDRVAPAHERYHPGN